jgi:hypothetical protein
VVYSRGGAIAHAYFPITAIYSTVMISEEGTPMAGMTIGREGMVGLPACFGVDFSTHITIVQVPGRALKVPLAFVLSHMRDCKIFDRLLHLYGAFRYCYANQAIGCSRLHSVEERASSALLACHDRVGRGEFSMTHESLSEMLGVRRQSVSIAAKAMSRAGLISYRHGIIEVLDRSALETCSCECYEAFTDLYGRIFGEGEGDRLPGMYPRLSDSPYL